MRKLKDCKSFGEIYEVVGEDNFSAIAKMLIIIMVAGPLFCGVLNFGMLLDWDTYYAYEYNNKCISVMHVIFSLITIWSMIYYFGKIQYEKKNFSQIVKIVKEDNPWLLPWFALLVWTIIPVLCSANIAGAIVGTTFLSAGYVTHFFMFGILGCSAMISADDRRDLFESFVIMMDILAIITLSFEYNWPFFGKFTATGGISVYTNQNHYAYVIAMVALTLIGLYYANVVENGSVKRRAFYIVSFVMNIYTLMINDTMGAYVGIVFGYAFIIIIWKCSGRKLGWRCWMPGIIIIVITVLSGTGIIPPCKTWEQGTTIGQSIFKVFGDIFKITHKSEGYKDAGSLRWGIWIDTVDMIFERPILGYGPDVMHNKFDRWVVDSAHNEYLECAFFLGVPGLLLYLGGLFTILVNKCKQLKSISVDTLIAAGAAIAYLISAFFGVRKFNSVCFFFMFMGLLVKRNLKKN